MDGRTRYRQRLKDFDLDLPERKLAYTRLVFSAVARRYDVITRILSFGRDRRWKQLLMQGLPDCGQIPSAVCLDLASGTGDIVRLLANRYPHGVIDAVDLNPEMIARARRRLRRAARATITLHLANMNELPFADGRFDVVTGGYALRNAPHLADALREIHRVLKPGGIAAFLEFSTWHAPRVRRLQLRLLELWGGVWGLLLHGNPEVYAYISRSLAKFPDFEELPRTFERAGFRDTRQRRLFGGMLALTFALKPAS